MEEKLRIMNWEYEKHSCKYTATHTYVYNKNSFWQRRSVSQAQPPQINLLGRLSIIFYLK